MPIRTEGERILLVNCCPVCRNDGAAKAATRKDGREVRRCATCTALYLSERPRDILAYYQHSYFEERSNDAQTAGIGYHNGYPRIVEQAWQGGAALALAALAGAEFRSILDIGSAKGHFLAYCHAFGWDRVEGVEPVEQVALDSRSRGFRVMAQPIESFRGDSSFSVATAWDVIEHLADPAAFVSKLVYLLSPNGVFIFSTPNGDVPLTMPEPDRWKGFETSFEHLVYFTTLSLQILLAPVFADVRLYPFKLYDFDFLLGIGSRKKLESAKAALFSELFDDTTLLLAAADAGKIPAEAISGLALACAQFGREEATKVLVAWALKNSERLRDPRLATFAAGITEHQARRASEARDCFEHAARSTALADLAWRCCADSLTMSFQEYRQDKEIYIAGLVGDVERQTKVVANLEDENSAARAELGRQQFENAQAQRRLQGNLTAAERQARRVESDFRAYVSDKEMYIAGLLGRLASLAWAESLGNAPLQVARKLKSLLRKALRTLRLGPPKHLRRWLERAAIRSTGVNQLSMAVFPPGVARRSKPTPLEKVSLIATVKNEGVSLFRWWEAILAQSRLPDEVVVVDGGSTDATGTTLAEIMATSKVPFRWFEEKGASIAAGRNAAIEMATHDIIASTDLGCHPDPSWLAEIVAPFEADPGLEVVCGLTRAHAETPFEEALSTLTVYRPEDVDPATYLPSSRTLAFRRAAWRRAGFYPQWLTFAGEDTLFALHLRKTCPRWAFAPGAVVYWHMRSTRVAAAKQAYLYGIGDGEAALFPERFFFDLKALATCGAGLAGMALAVVSATIGCTWARWGASATVAGAWSAVSVGSALVAMALLRAASRKFSRYLPATGGASLTARLQLSMLLMTILTSRCRGFLQGMRNRPEVARRRFAKTAGTCIVLSGVPIHDSGGGQRATQLALEWLDRGYRVVFLNEYPTYESASLNLEIFHPCLETHDRRQFDAGSVLFGHPSGKPLVAIVEFPHPEFLAPLRVLKQAGAKIVYDLIDDWRSPLGGEWYTEATERKVVALSDVLAASARDLADRLAGESDREVLYVPNAVNTRLFRPGSHARPVDLPRGKPIFIYIGALWGVWFDWDLLVAVADAFPDGQIVAIGDYRGQCPEERSNLHFLGLKPQRDLAPYLAYADAALIPFRLSRLTHSVSPLKAFEYLAMGVPVVATPLRELQDLPYVFTGENHADFIAAARLAIARRPDSVVVAEFAAAHSWKSRVDSLVAHLGE